MRILPVFVFFFPPLYSHCLAAAHAPKKYLLVRELQRERGRAGGRRETPGRAGWGRALAHHQPTAGRPTSAEATPQFLSAPEEVGKEGRRDLGAANQLWKSEKAGKKRNLKKAKVAPGTRTGEWAEGRAGLQVTQSGSSE